MDFDTFLKEYKGCKGDDASIRAFYRDVRESSKDTFVKQTKVHSIMVGMVAEVEFVEGKIREDGSKSDPKTVFTLVGGTTRLHFSGRTDNNFRKHKNRQTFFRVSISSFGNNTLYHRIEEILDTKQLLDLLSLSHLSRNSK